jgi:hypothetical protein
VLALISVLVPTAVVNLAALAVAVSIVIWLLATFARKR